MKVRRKWRPPLALLVAALVVLVFVLPTVAMGVVVAVSRAPGELIASLQENWLKIALALAAVFAVSALTGFVFWRGLSQPLQILADRAGDVARGADVFSTDGSYGTREVAQLAESFAVVVDRLQQRSKYLETLSVHLAHELKSPLTSIRGAAELMRDDVSKMETAQRRHFLDNIIADTEQLTMLVSRLRDLARADLKLGEGSVRLADLAGELKAAFPGLTVEIDAPASLSIPLPPESAAIVLHHIADNAVRHGARTLTVRAGDLTVDIGNDGSPIAPEAARDLFTPFFTTRRHDGGTGLGLAIVSALLHAAGGRIELLTSDPVVFRMSFS